ncbi:haloacid dehalogenase-like hydrolase domain-containing 5 isoform X2 [Protopterus annectens]|uniref:haloacid dehalogenase-like hydrolase domain-containing 5 isoform X2 n=1 Tax=Protopterus annectens TaxID=7888 RepID=UPI001CFAA3FA|nr:haloacid dehalogenase-like hydrolase domain-containing 5 isoform X2 [Protopterus annectens]
MLKLCTINSQNVPKFGLLFDIDGVLLRGRTPLPAAKEAFRKLVNPQGQPRVPFVFVTNAANCLQRVKAEQLSCALEVPIGKEQVIMAHTPLFTFHDYHEKHVLISGQGPVLEIAQNRGFRRSITIEMLREAFPLLDSVDRSRRATTQPAFNHDIPQIEAVILFGEPVRWETNLQLIIDVLLTNGTLDCTFRTAPYPHIPVLACNMDLLWLAEAETPRFGHGTFMVCLETLYEKISGHHLKYEALLGKPSPITYECAEDAVWKQAQEQNWSHPITTLYAIGDNPMTDIYGANLYNRILEKKYQKGAKARIHAKIATSQGVSTEVTQEEDHENREASPVFQCGATSCKSILVCTGVYSPHEQDAAAAGQLADGFHGHRDFAMDPALVEPTHIVPDVNGAVDLIFELENFSAK